MFSGGPPSQSRTLTTPAEACWASSVDCSTTAGATAAITPATTRTASSSVAITAAAGGRPLLRSQRTGGHSTVHAISASNTGSRITHVSPTTQASTHSAAATATNCTATTALERRWTAYTDPRSRPCVVSSFTPLFLPTAHPHHRESGAKRVTRGRTARPIHRL